MKENYTLFKISMDKETIFKAVMSITFKNQDDKVVTVFVISSGNQLQYMPDFKTDKSDVLNRGQK